MTSNIYTISNLPDGFSYISDRQTILTPIGIPDNREKYAGTLNSDGSVKNGRGFLYDNVDTFVREMLMHINRPYTRGRDYVAEEYENKYVFSRMPTKTCCGRTYWDITDPPTYEDYQKKHYRNLKIKECLKFTLSVIVFLFVLVGLTYLSLHHYKII